METRLADLRERTQRARERTDDLLRLKREAEGLESELRQARRRRSPRRARVTATTIAVLVVSAVVGSLLVVNLWAWRTVFAWLP